MTATEQAIADLHALGARFVRLTPDTKAANEFRWQFKPQKPLEEAIANYRHANCIGIEPISVDHSVVDVDCGEKPDGAKPSREERLAVVSDIVRHFGGPKVPTGIFPSSSCYPVDKGKRHIWIPVDPAIDAPLGLKDDGKPRMMSTRLFWDGYGGWQAFDIRFKHGYVACESYLIELLSALTVHRSFRSRMDFPSAKLRDLDAHGQRGKPPRYARAEFVYPTCTGLIERDQGIRQAERHVRKQDPIPAQHCPHVIINRYGFIAGLMYRTNPWAKDVFIAHLRGGGIPEDRLRYYFTRGFNDGLHGKRRRQS